jgi:spore coat polysaccharide biosynthesis protein SpsF
MVRRPLSKKVVAIIQARVGSTRLPRKVLLPLPYGGHKTALEQIIDRAKLCRNVDEVMVATSTSSGDNAIQALCRKIGVRCFRGSENNVLSRYFGAARKSNADIIIRLTGDNPCIDPEFIDKNVAFHIKKDLDYSSTDGLPLGMNIEIVSFSALEKANKYASKEHEKEHVTPYFYYSHPEKFRRGKLSIPGSFKKSSIRVTMDTPQDYALISLVYGELYAKKKAFSVKDIIELYRKKPWISLINGNVVQKKLFKDLKAELKEAVTILDMQDMVRARDFISTKIKGMK